MATFTTLETPDLSQTWLVQHSDGSLLPFSADRLFLSLYESLKHRDSAITDARNLTSTIISKLYKHISQGVITLGDMTQITVIALSRFDRTASMHYQAFYTHQS